MEPLNFGNGEREPKASPRSMPRYRKRRHIMLGICVGVVSVLISVGVATTVNRNADIHRMRLMMEAELQYERSIEGQLARIERDLSSNFIEAIPVTPVVESNPNRVQTITIGENGYFKLEIPFIAAGEIVRIGHVDSASGIDYQAIIHAGRGHGVFIGMTSRPNATGINGIPWGPANSNGGNPTASIAITNSNNNRYLYAGSSSTISSAGVDLYDVRIVIAPSTGGIDNWFGNFEEWIEGWVEYWDNWADEWYQDWGIWSEIWYENWHSNRNNNFSFPIPPVPSITCPVPPIPSATCWDNNANTCDITGETPPVDLYRLAPFMSSEALSEMAMELFNSGFSVNIQRLAPFMLTTDIDEVVLAMINGGATVELANLAPFMSQAAVSEAALLLINNGVSLDVHRLAPFLTRDVVDELVRRIVN